MATMRHGFIRADVDTTFNADRGRVSIDPVLPTQGALLLIDPTHPVLGAWEAGVPASGGTVPNLAWDHAAAVLGSGTEESLACAMDYSGMSGSKGLIERTTRGGLHGIFSQTQNVAAGDTTHMSIRLPEPLRLWISTGAAKEHSTFVSVWGATTRVTNMNPGQFEAILELMEGNTTAGRALIRSNGAGYPNVNNTNHLGSSHYPAAVLPAGPFRKALGTGAAGGVFVSYGADSNSVFAVGNVGLNRYSGGSTPVPLGHSGSRVLYRVYVEDLTVSGRTYAEVDALDQSLFASEVLTAGGRYYGDTYTNPSTLP
ncbi:hypothetical protein [Changpingibacter yushuensis]|uniref:hypothetical protein n=1 Tax=Changpingibacter yushuensis TaxID=2758440 RepID=UPI00165D7DE0|nr:hypothetical protein [Changpingibacter yushuensis]